MMMFSENLISSTSAISSSDFFPYFFGGRFSVVYHAFYLLFFAVELYGFTTIFVAAGVGFFLGPLLSVLFGVLLKHFILPHGVFGDLQQACFFTVWMIARMGCMIFLRFPARPFSGLVVGDASTNLCFLALLAWLESALVVIL